jgi:hypothetical protein
MSNEQAEVVEAEHENTDAVTIIEPPQTADQMDSVIAISKRIDEYAKAHDTIVGAVVKRSYPGDWVCHKKDGDEDENQKVNMGAAAAERMAAFVGITESNWTTGGKEWSDDHKHYTWTYEADFTFGRRTVHVVSRVGTRDKFFGKKGQEWKPLEDVQEDDIKKAAFRACRKEGVRTLLGLRNVPVSKLKELGFDISKINFVSFETKGKTLAADQKMTNESGVAKRKVKIKDIIVGWSGPKNVRWDMTDAEGVKFSFFSNKDSKRAAILLDAKSAGEVVEIAFTTELFNNREQYIIQAVNGAVDK